MLLGASTDLFNPLVPKAHNSECQNLLLSLRIKPLKVNLKLISGFFLAPSELMGYMSTQHNQQSRPSYDDKRTQMDAGLFLTRTISGWQSVLFTSTEAQAPSRDSTRSASLAWISSTKR